MNPLRRHSRFLTILLAAGFAFTVGPESVLADDEDDFAPNWDEVAGEVIPKVKARLIEVDDFVRVYHKGKCLVVVEASVNGSYMGKATADLAFEDKNDDGRLSKAEIDWEKRSSDSMPMTAMLAEMEQDVINMLTMTTSRLLEVSPVKGEATEDGWKLTVTISAAPGAGMKAHFFVDRSYRLTRIKATPLTAKVAITVGHEQVGDRWVTVSTHEVTQFDNGGRSTVDRRYGYTNQNGCLLLQGQSKASEQETFHGAVSSQVTLTCTSWEVEAREQALPRFVEKPAPARPDPEPQPDPDLEPDPDPDPATTTDAGRLAAQLDGRLELLRRGAVKDLACDLESATGNETYRLYFLAGQATDRVAVVHTAGDLRPGQPDWAVARAALSNPLIRSYSTALAGGTVTRTGNEARVTVASESGGQQTYHLVGGSLERVSSTDARGAAQMTLTPEFALRDGANGLLKSVKIEGPAVGGTLTVHYKYTRAPGFVFLKRMILEWQSPQTEAGSLELELLNLKLDQGEAARHFAAPATPQPDPGDDDDLFED